MEGPAMPSRPIQPRGKARIFVVDDHPLVRDGLATRLAREADMDVCGEADSVEQAAVRIRAQRPDLVILDLSLGQQSGLDVLRQAQTPDHPVRMLILSNYSEDVYAERALRAGAMGYVSKSASWDVVVEAIRTVLTGKRYFSPELAERLICQTVGARRSRPRGAVPAGPASLVESLSDRELEVFRLIGQGMPTREIARQLFLSPHTIDSHRENIKVKLKLDNGSELKRMAILWVMENP
jgi:DNA-binding NarL/FixJ family response regulator